jgi:hypothetical protein
LTACGAESERFERVAGLESHARSEAPQRFHAEPVFEFIAMDYGEIFPFLGEIIMDEWGGAFERFGFINAAGQIICEPIFESIDKVSHGGRHVFVASSSWISPEVRAWNYELFAYRGREMPPQGFRAVIAADGSFIHKFEDVYTGDFTFDFDFELIPVKRDGRWGTMDFDGNLVTPFAFPNAPLFSEGLAPVFEWAELRGMWEFFAENIPVHYIDPAGNIVLGPFGAPDMVFYAEMVAQHLEALTFIDGMAKNFVDGRYGFIDRAGRVIIPHDFLLFRSSQFGWNEAGLALVALADTYEEIENEWGHPEPFVSFALIDRQGNIVVQMPQSHTHGGVNAHLGYFEVIGPEWDLAAMFDFYGNEIEVPEGVRNHIGNGFFRAPVDSWQGERILGNGADRLFRNSSVHWLVGDWLSVSVRDEDYDDFLWNARTGEERPGANIWVHWRDISPGRHIVHAWTVNESRFGMIDDDANILLDFDFTMLRPIGENFFARQGRYGGLLDSDGEWLVRVRLTGNFD